MPVADLDVPAFIIAELTGLRRTLTLTKRALPFKPFSLDGKQRNEVTFYQGNPIGEVTVLGPSEQPTTINGRWCDMFLGESSATVVNGGSASAYVANQQLTTADALCDLVDSMKDNGSIVEVRWGRKVRRGIIDGFKQDWDNVNDVAWSITFNWTSKGQAPPRTSVDPPSPADVRRRLSRRVTEARDAVNDPTANTSLMERIDDILRTIEESVTSLDGAVQNQVDRAMGPLDLARRTTSILTGVIGRNYELVQELRSTTVDDVLDPFRSVIAGPVSLAQSIAAESWIRGIEGPSRAMSRDAAITRQQMLADLGDDILAIYTAKEGENLRDVSTKFYNTPNSWQKLLSFNDLYDSALKPGQIVLIPKVFGV